jgi:hypothetical protein
MNGWVWRQGDNKRILNRTIDRTFEKKIPYKRMMMEKNFYHNDFEELIKEKADLYKMYPSDKVWKGIERSLRFRRRWYWSGFVVLLSGISYLAITEIMSPVSITPIAGKENSSASKPKITTQQLIPFSDHLNAERNSLPLKDVKENSSSDISIEDKGDITATFEIPLKLLPGNLNASPQEKASVYISGLEPLRNNEQYNIELSWPVADIDLEAPADLTQANASEKIILRPGSQTQSEEKPKINWLMEQAAFKMPVAKTNRISWQLAFSPTINYRKLTGSSNTKLLSTLRNIPLSLRVEGDVERLVNHKPALGFELGTHGLMKLKNWLTFKGGVQFNYSKYDIRAFRAPGEFATIALNSQTGNSLVSYTDIRNFGGSSVEDLKNQYFQLSMPIGFEVRVFGNEKVQFNIASTIQPTYLINRNTYLITTDFKNYTKEPSLVRQWNVNAGAEAFIAYEKGGVKWQVGPQFRYQLLSSYQNAYPIKEYLMEYGIKVGITKTIR